MKVFGLDQNM